MKTRTFWLLTALTVAIVFALSRLVTNDYFFFAAYLVLQYIVLATAWNILGGYTGYVNFGTAGSSRSAPIPPWCCTSCSARRSRCRSSPAACFRACSASAWAISRCACGACSLRSRPWRSRSCCRRSITNWDYVGGSRGVYIIRPAQAPLIGNYIQYLFFIMLVLAGISVAIARTIEHSTLGLGSLPFATTSNRPRPRACRPCD